MQRLLAYWVGEIEVGVPNEPWSALLRLHHRSTAWGLFGSVPTGWARVQAICDYVHRHITFGYEHARNTRTAFEALHDRTGVCRDYAHLAVALCRCMNIPARYCTGYLGDIGVPPPHGTMDFAAWFESSFLSRVGVMLRYTSPTRRSSVRSRTLRR